MFGRDKINKVVIIKNVKNIRNLIILFYFIYNNVLIYYILNYFYLMY